MRLAATREEGFYLASSEAFDLIVLDRMLPGRDGLELDTALDRGSVFRIVLPTPPEGRGRAAG